MANIRERHKYRVVAYVAAVSGVAAITVALFVARWGLPQIGEVLFFWVLYAIGDRLSIEGKVRGIPRAGLKPRLPELSAGFLVLMAAAFSTDPVTVAAIGIASPLVPGTWRGLLRTAFNAAQTSIYGGAASAAYFLTQARFGTRPAILVVSAVAGSVVAVALNTGLVAGVMGLERGRNPIRVLRELAWPTIGSIPFAFAALLVAILYGKWGAIATIFILAPLFVLRRSRRGQVDLEAARERTLRAFVRAVELKDPYTSRHSERVAAIAVELHRSLGASEEFLERRYYGALLHDVGKVAVSGRILTKSGRLSSEEYDVIKRHPGSGAFVVSGVSFLRDIVPEVLHHHERIDGAGYPSGLSGDEIPFEARVLAVADTFEALTSDRPYRRGLSHYEALAEIQRSSGSQLDPLPVEALTSLLRGGQLFPILPQRTLESKEPQRLAVAQEA